MADRLLVLHDSADFGGHERILLDLLPAVLDGSRFDEVTFYVPGANHRLQAALAALAAPRLRIEIWPFTKRRAEPYLYPFRRLYARHVRRIVAREQPHTTLLVQGRIEHLAVPAMALSADERIVSYLPMAHRLTDMGRSGWLGDRIRRRLYRRPDLFIVPDSAVAGGARDEVSLRHRTARCGVVEQGGQGRDGHRHGGGTGVQSGLRRKKDKKRSRGGESWSCKVYC